MLLEQHRKQLCQLAASMQSFPYHLRYNPDYAEWGIVGHTTDLNAKGVAILYETAHLWLSVDGKGIVRIRRNLLPTVYKEFIQELYIDLVARTNRLLGYTPEKPTPKPAESFPSPDIKLWWQIERAEKQKKDEARRALRQEVRGMIAGLIQFHQD